MHKGKFSYLMDRKVMRNPSCIEGDQVCGERGSEGPLLAGPVVPDGAEHRFDITPQLPTNVRDRPTCYWGINCRTMDHNPDHARRYNHCVYQSRF